MLIVFVHNILSLCNALDFHCIITQKTEPIHHYICASENNDNILHKGAYFHSTYHMHLFADPECLQSSCCNAVFCISSKDRKGRQVSQKYSWVGCESSFIQLFINQPDLCPIRHVSVSLCFERIWDRTVGSVCCL